MTTTVEVFAVEPTTVQLTWRGAPGGPLTIDLGGRVVTADTGVGPGGLVIDGLAPGKRHQASVAWHGLAPIEVSFRTTDDPPGPELCRIATIGDLHLGQRTFGARGRIVDNSIVDGAAGVRCARQAAADAVDWGAELLVVKGDLTNSGRRIEWQQAAAVLEGVPIPVLVLPGNHEVSSRRTIEPWQAGAELGLDVVRSVQSVELPGIRVVAGTTSMPGRSRGRLSQRHEELIGAISGSAAALVILHHHLERGVEVPFWPPGIPQAEAVAFLDELGRVQPRSLVTSGHTHRYRRRMHGPVTITQVGSTKDYPGGWSGYAVHEGGIRQVVRRVVEPSCMVWTEETRRALGGLWPRIGPGRLDDRCFTLDWP